MYYTFSRGAMWAGVTGVLVYLVVGRPRAWVGGALATIGPTVIALMSANPPGRLTAFPLSDEAVSHGHRVALVLAATAIVACLLRALALRLDRAIDGFHLSTRVKRVLVLASALLAMGAMSSAAVALNAPHAVSDKVDEFRAKDKRVANTGSGRLFSLGNNGRIEHWTVALDVYRTNKFHGAGAGTYELAWARYRTSSFTVKDGHSLYVEALDELGYVGLILVGTLMLTVLFGFARLARGPDRALGGALFAAGVAWALHAGIDWDWEMTAATIWLFALGGAALARAQTKAPSADPARQRSRLVQLPIRGAVALACLVLAILPARIAIAQSHLRTALGEARSGNCAGGVSDARRSLKTFKSPAAYQTIAWCTIERHPPLALQAITAALEVDPNNWELHYALSISRAANGLDPRPEMRTAARLNPHARLPKEALRDFQRGHGARRWHFLARRTPLTLPS
jgi:hypothetical protein